VRDEWRTTTRRRGRFDPYVRWTYIQRMARSSASTPIARRARGARLGFRVDAKTKALVERAARLERRNLTDYCLSALNHAAQQTLDRHGSLVLSEADRVAFFEALVSAPKPNARLRKALRRELTLLKP